jgi:carbamoyltransferase
MAATVQKITEEILIKTIDYFTKKYEIFDVCLAGGVFLNCVANVKIKENTKVKNMFIQPAAGDSGGALGCALYSYHYMNLSKKSENYYVKNDFSAFLGPFYENEEIEIFLENSNYGYEKYEYDELLDKAVSLLEENKIIAFFKGRHEFGPRALGNRSILANPLKENITEYLNFKVKNREWFRPYGIIILEEFGTKYLETFMKNEYMILASRVVKDAENIMKNVMHKDKTVRYQSVKNGYLKDLLYKFYEKTNCPFLINTSFNYKGEPIVCSVKDALKSFEKTNCDFLIIGDYLVWRK